MFSELTGAGFSPRIIVLLVLSVVVAVGLVDRHLSLILMYFIAMKQCIGDVSVRNEEKESASHPRHDKITRIVLLLGYD